MREPVRGLADQVGVEEDGQTHAAGADVANRESHLAGQRLLDAEFAFVGVGRNEVGIEAVEALGAEDGGTADGRCRATRGDERAAERWTGGSEGHIGILQRAVAAGHCGAG